MAEPRARRATDPLAAAPPTNRRKDRPNRPNGLTKQTYSALVHLPGSSHPRKWHVVAYFTVSRNIFTMIRSQRVSHPLLPQGDDYLRLPVIENYDYLRSLRVPEGIFTSSKANGVRSDRRPMTNSREGHTPIADFPARPDSVHYSQHPMSHEVPSRPKSSVSPPSSSPLSPMHWDPYSPPTQSTTSRTYPHHTALPSVVVLTSPHAQPDLPPNLRASHPVRLNRPSPSSYSPLSAEDRRVLSSFRVVL